MTFIKDDHSTVTAYSGPDFGIIQGDINTLQQVAVTLNLDISNIPELTMNDAFRKVLKDTQMGNKLFRRFLSENKQIDITTSQNLQQLSMLVNIKMMLDAGALVTAREMLSMVPADAFLVTPGYASGAERKQSYIDEINNYLNSQTI